MSSPLRVRCFYGAWQRTEEGIWIFKRKPSDLGYTILLKPTETYANMETLIRARYKLNDATPLAFSYQPPVVLGEPDASRTPPTSVTTTSDVEVMMQLRSSFPELRLCVCSGPEDVAHYQFLTNPTLNRGGITCEFSGLTERPLVASKSVLEEIFTPAELVSIYRASFEIEKNKAAVREVGVSSSEYGPPESYEDYDSSPAGSDV